MGTQSPAEDILQHMKAADNLPFNEYLSGFK
jgi:hypothetical protein